MITILISVFFALIAGVIGYLSGIYFGKDNPIEEECEKVIKKETGLEVDLSPNSTPSSTKPLS